MKSIRRGICMALAIMLTMSMVACGEAKLIGKWANSDAGIENVYVFDKDGKGSVQNVGPATEFTYTYTDDKLIITIIEQKVEYGYKLDGDKLTLSYGGNEQVYTRK